MKRYAAILVAVLLLLLSLSGCAPELHERLIIRAVGIDRTEIGYRVTVRTASDNEKEISFTGEGRTAAQALENMAQNTGKKPLYSHTAVLIFGNTCAQEGLQGALDFFLRHYDSRPEVKVFLAENTAEEILTANENETTQIGAEEIAAITHAEKYSGTAVETNLITLINGVYGANQSAVLPIIRKESGLEITGTGLIRDMRLCGILDPKALRGYLLLCGKLEAGESVIFDETCGTVSIAANSSRCAIRFTGTKDDPQFTVRAEIEGDISSVSNEDSSIRNEVFMDLETQFASNMTEYIAAYLNTAVFSLGCDAAGLGYAVLRENPAVCQAVTDDLQAFLQNVTVEILVTARINRVEEEDRPYL